MLSDEEKKAINELKEEINKPVEVQGNKFNTFILYNIESAKTILNLIEKQSKEIEELKEKEKNLLIQLKDSEKELLEVCEKLRNSVSKDKIKAKIEEYKKQIEKMEKNDIGRGFTLGKEWSDLKAKVEFGQSLLEKE